MKLVFSEIFAPVLPLRLTASVHSQGDATVFEKMAMSLVSIGSESDELRGHTIPALFEILIQGRLDDDIVDRTVEDLFSPANGLLAVANPDILFSTYRDIPVSEIEILPAGRVLLETGRFPTEPETRRFSAVYDPLANAVSETRTQDVPRQSVRPATALPASLANEVPAELARDFVERNGLRPGQVLSEVERIDSGEPVWIPFRASVELEGGVLSAKSSRSGAEAYLNHLAPDAFRGILLSGLEPYRAQAFGPARDLSRAEAANLYAPGETAPSPTSWVRLRPNSAGGSSDSPETRLLVVWAEAGDAVPSVPAFERGPDGSPDRLVLPSSPYPDPNARGDLRSLSHVVLGRATFAETPMEIPVGCRELLSSEDAKALASSLFFALVGSSDPRALAHAAVLAADAGLADAHGILQGHVGSLDEKQRLEFEKLCREWNADGSIRKEEPEKEPPQETPADSPDSAEAADNAACFFDLNAAFHFQNFFKMRIEEMPCRFFLTHRLLAVMEKNARSSWVGNKSAAWKEAVGAIRTSPFLSLVGEEPRPLSPDEENPGRREDTLSELLRLASEWKSGPSLLVTDNPKIANRASALGVRPMTTKVFARHIENNA